MDPLKVSAQFAAFVWSSNQQEGQPAGEQEAARFARENWIAFLPCAHEGLGRFLIRIAQEQNRHAAPCATGLHDENWTSRLRVLK